MKIKTLLFNNVTLALGQGAFVADSATKASCLFDVEPPLLGLVPVVETVESSSERVTGGAVRLMAKATFRVPRIDYSQVTMGGPVKLGATDTITVHTVVAFPKAVGEAMLTSAGTTGCPADVRDLLAYLVAKGLIDISGVLGSTVEPALPATTPALLSGKVLSVNAPLRRALASLQPIDTSNGLYGGAV